jgi:two-component system, sporulation sensor kinase E
MTQPGEIGELARLMQTFNQATEKLAQSYQRIGELQRQVAEKDRQLSRKTRLEMLGRMAAALAHEIRNPLGGIQLYASMLRRDLDSDAEKVRTLDRILSAVAGLEKLVEDMLTYGRDLEPRKTVQPLATIVEAALDLARAAIGEKGIAVLRDLDGASAAVDGEMMSRVFLNVILNAVQAMEPGGTLRVATRGTTASFEDTGPGIPADMMDKLFTPFVTSKAKGTGLGLAIAQKIVEAHGGAIEARNNPGRGATFTVRV